MDRGQAPARADTSAAAPSELALHNKFQVSVRALKRDLVRAIHYLCAVSDRNVHKSLGYANIEDYGRDVGGLSRNQTRAFLTIGRRLRDLPALRRAITNGDLSWAKAAQIAAPATAETEQQLLGLASGLSTGQLRMTLAGKGSPSEVISPKARSADPGPPSAAPRPRTIAIAPPSALPIPAGIAIYVTYRLTGEQYARWEAAQARLRTHADTKEELLCLALAALADNLNGAGGTGPGILLTFRQCPDCARAALVTGRGDHEVEPALLAATACDAVVEDRDGRRRAIIPPRMRRTVLARDGYRCRARTCTSRVDLQAHHRIPVAKGGKTEPGNLITLCGRCHRALHRAEDEDRRLLRDPAG